MQATERAAGPTSGVPAAHAPCWVVRPGLLPYDAARRWQHALVAARAGEMIPDLLVLLEHPPVYTLGRGANKAHVLWDAELRRLHGVDLHESERGGDVTYHGPGQLVGYPIVRLEGSRRDVHWFLRNVEEVLIRVLADFGLKGCREPGLTGVWVEGRKVAAIGVAFRKWVSYHGFALNVNPNLEHFRGIVPCGLADRGVTSLAELLGGEAPGMGRVMDAVVRHFEDVFACRASEVFLAELEKLGLGWLDADPEGLSSAARKAPPAGPAAWGPTSGGRAGAQGAVG